MQNILRLNENDITEAISAYYGVNPDSTVLIINDDSNVEIEVEFTNKQMASIWANRD